MRAGLTPNETASPPPLFVLVLSTIVARGPLEDASPARMTEGNRRPKKHEIFLNAASGIEELKREKLTRQMLTTGAERKPSG